MIHIMLLEKIERIIMKERVETPPKGRKKGEIVRVKVGCGLVGKRLHYKGEFEKRPTTKLGSSMVSST